MALYRKHRPQTFASVVDQAPIVTTLSNQIAHNKTVHAYLFCGPRGVGKTTTARILAKALNCEKRKEGVSEPCDACDACAEISAARSIDVIEIDAASHTGVDNVRENIIENAQFKPTKSPYKIFIIDEVHMLSTSAFNALLKTLEEPPAHVLFILATTDAHKLPETILSRCQQFTFRKVDAKEMKKCLTKIAKAEGVKFDDAVLDRVIKKSEGCLRDAIGLIDQLMATGDKEITPEDAELLLPTPHTELHYALTEALFKKDAAAGLTLVNNLVEQGINIAQFMNDLIEFLRSLMMYAIDPDLVVKELDVNDATTQQLKSLSLMASSKEVVTLTDAALKRSQELRTTPLAQLPLEMLIVEWSTQGHIPASLPAHETVQQPQQSASPPPSLKVVNEETPQKTLTEKVKELVHIHPALSPDEVNNKWNEFVQQVEKQWPSLVFVLKMTDITSVDGHTVHLSVHYNFHRDKLMEKKTRAQLENVLTDVMGSHAKIEVTVNEEGAPVTKKEAQELQDLATVLGGEVIH